MQQQGRAKLQNFEKVRFTFDGLDRYLLMNVNTKIALEDLKFTIQQVFNLDLFARRLNFYIQNKSQSLEQLLRAQLPLSQQLFDAEVFKRNQKEYHIFIRFVEEGA